MLYGHDRCPLCARLEEMIAPHLARIADAHLVKRDIHDEPEWMEAYGHRVPVLMLGERGLLEGRPSEDEVREAIGEGLN